MKGGRVIETTEKKKRGRPPKNKTIDKPPSQTLVANTKEEEIIRQTYNFMSVFKEMNGGNLVVNYSIRNYTVEQIETYIENPIQYQSQLIDLSNYIYSTYSGFYREIIDFYVKPTLFRHSVEIKAMNSNFDKAKSDKIKKDFINYSARINQLNLGREFHRILLKMFLEDAVFGYWLEEGESATLYYLPSNWCLIRKTSNGNWAYEINTARISQRDIEKLPKELQSLINKYKGKAGDLAYAPVPMEKSLCVKFLDNLNYIVPPFVYIISLIVELGKAKQIALAKDEGDASVLLEMRIPIDDKDDDHLRLTEPIIKQFATGVQDLLPPNVAVLPTPMPLNILQTNKAQASEKSVVKNSIDAFQEETFVPSLGASNTSAEMKRAIQNAFSKVFVLLDQIAQAVNLKMKIDGYANYGSYEFELKLLHINVFNEEDVIDSMLKLGQSGSVNKFDLAAAQGKPPATLIAQSKLENEVFRDMFDSFTVLQSSHVQSGSSGSEGGAPLKKEDDLTDSGIKSRDDGVNAPEARDT